MYRDIYVLICVYDVYPDICNSDSMPQSSPLCSIFSICISMLSAPHQNTHPGTQLQEQEVSLRETLAAISTTSSRALTQILCMGEEQTVEQMAADLYPEELTLFATAYGEV